jgi:ribose transport system permease protein
VVAAGGMMAAAATAYGPAGEVLAIPFGVACGVVLGFVNGIGVAYLRIPSMIITLATNAVAQGLMVVHTGGFSPQDSASVAMRFIATGETLFGLPNAVIVWALIGSGAAFLLNRTVYGRYVYAIGNRERAAYLSGVDTRRAVMFAFAISGGLSAFGGVLLAGYASKAAQAMGDPYLLPSIAAVVLGGTALGGGRGSVIATAVGVLFLSQLEQVISALGAKTSVDYLIQGAIVALGMGLRNVPWNQILPGRRGDVEAAGDTTSHDTTASDPGRTHLSEPKEEDSIDVSKT